MNDSPQHIVGFKIASDPPIFWGPSMPGALLGIAEQLAARIGNRRAYFLIRLSWTRDDVPTVEKDIVAMNRLRKQYPEHRHVILCNTRSELALFAGHSVPGIICSTLAFVDETVFDIDSNVKKEFDAVYNAALVPFKRHELCRDVQSLALLYHRFHPAKMQDPAYPARMRALLPQATFVNELNGDYRFLDIGEVAGWLARARVGLCLSHVEGAMRAAVEYLLCGLPVVSTPSIGGRERVLDPAWSKIVDPTPEAVAGAVAELIARPVDPTRIRLGTFEKLRPDRIRLLKLIAAIHESEGVSFPKQAPWERLFRIGTWPVALATDLLEGPAIADMSGG